jgi:DDE_Tnp_1-associated/Transposase DDE domain
VVAVELDYVDSPGWNEAGVAVSVIMELLRSPDFEQGPHPLMSSSLIDAVRLDPTCGIDAPAYLQEHEQRDLLRALVAVPDPQHRRGVRYRLASLLAVAVCAMLAGASTFAAIGDWVADLDEAARRRLGFAGRIPAGSTVWRFLIRVDAQVPQAVLTGWLRHRLPTRPTETGKNRVVIAVDGKTLRGARLPGGRQVHLLSAYDTDTGIVLAQVPIAAKSNEIPAFTPLLDQLQAQFRSLAGTIIVADALHAQVRHAHAVNVRGGQLMVTVKANQPTVYACSNSWRGRRYQSGTKPAAAGTAVGRPALSKR